MRIALFSDIHANLPALEAFFEDLEKQNADMVFCLGDLVGYNIWPNEVVEEIRKRGIPCIAGNYDFGVGRNSDDCGCAYKTEEDEQRGKESIKYTNSVISDDNRRYLKELPAHQRIHFGSEKDPVVLLLVHGSPRKINEYLFEDRKDESLERMMKEAGADIMCFGHTHKPYHKRISSGGRNIHAINIGSVGKPKDGDPRGCYAMLDYAGEAGLKVEFIRFEYDVEKAAKAVEGSVLPDAFAEMLRKGV